MPAQQVRRIVYTLNNPTDDEKQDLGRLFWDEDVVSYHIFGNEVGEGGTPHLQGYLEFERRLTFRRVKQLVGSRAHIESARGSSSACIAYSKKDGDYHEWGSPRGQGRRNDLNEIRTAIAAGASELQIAEQHFSRWVVYRRSFDRYRQLICPSRSWKSFVVLLVGDTGVGKTRAVHECSERTTESLWIWGGDRWFDGYAGHSMAVFDDFDAGAMRTLGRGQVLRLLDRYAMQVPVKGSFVVWAPHIIFLTSNSTPRSWCDDFDDNGSTMRALLRRIDRVYEWDARRDRFDEDMGSRSQQSFPAAFVDFPTLELKL